MSGFRVSAKAGHRIDEIYQYTRLNRGETQADAYITGLFELFDDIAGQNIVWRSIPAEFGVEGYNTHYARHLVFWKSLSDGAVGIAGILHQSMDLGTRLSEDFKG